MSVEQLRQLIKDRLTLLGPVTLRLQETFGSSAIGEIGAPKRDDDQLTDCVHRLLAKKGNSLGVIADRLLTMAASPDLKKDQGLYWQYKAVIVENLGAASGFERAVKSV